MSDDKGKPDTFVPLTRDDVSDPALLPRQFRFLEGEVRELIGLLRRQVIPKINEIGDRLTALERDSRDRQRIGVVEDQLAELRVAILGRP